MTTQEYVYRVKAIEKVTDGDTYWLHLDVGFRQTQLTEIRLDGYDCPETRKGSPYERRQGAGARAIAADWFAQGLAGGSVWVRTEKDPDDFGRWLGEVWFEIPTGERGVLGDWLGDLALATPWPTRWHETYDPQRDRT